MNSRRSNSICKSPGPCSPKEHPILTRDISRSESLRSSSSCSHRIFRPCDLIHGEVLGKGFFGQAIKVCPLFSSFTLSGCQCWCRCLNRELFRAFPLQKSQYPAETDMRILEPSTGEVRGLASFFHQNTKQLFITLQRMEKNSLARKLVKTGQLVSSSTCISTCISTRFSLFQSKTGIWGGVGGFFLVH